MLEQIADAPLLGRQAALCPPVKKDRAVNGDPALIRRLYAGDTFQRRAFAAAGGAKYPQALAGTGKGDAKGKAFPLFFNVNG
jgi:hypothetical protein